MSGRLVAGAARFRCAFLAVAAAALWLASVPAGAAAQEPPRRRSPESLREQVLRKLELLEESRPGADTAGADTAAGAAESVPATGERALGEGGGGAGAGRAGPRPPGGEGAAAGAADSVVAELLALPGYEATRYQGADARFDVARRVLVLEAGEKARAQVERQGDEVAADSVIIYHDDEDLIEVHGNPTYTPQEGDPVQSRVMFYSLREGRGSALDAKTKFQQQGTWFVEGDLPSIRQDTVYGSHARFTSCDLEVPHYHFATNEIKMVGGGILVARPVVLYFADVPVAWLPFIAQSLKQGRRSGLLTPVFSVNDVVRTSRGYQRRISNVGFYWAMSDYSDAELALDWFSERFIALTGGVRYRWVRQFLDGSLNYRQFWRVEGGSELALNTNHSWQISERTGLRIAANYASNTAFVRQNSYDPREVTQSIDSEGGLSHRFDWGNLSLGATRRQFLSDDRVEMTLPTASVSLSPITLLPAPPSRAAWYNNVTWSGNVSLRQELFDRPPQPDTAKFNRGLADSRGIQASLSSNFTLGKLAWSQSFNFGERITRDVPEQAGGAEGDSASAGGAAAVPGAGLRDLSEASIGWSMSFDYQQRLIGSTTFTPQLSLSGRALRSDEVAAAQRLVSAPVRLSFGAGLKSDVYGFFPGFGSFSRIRHKVSPSVSYSYSPAVRPTPLQAEVFGDRESKAQNVIRIGLNQTFEAKVEETAPAQGPGAPAEGTPQAAGADRRGRAEPDTTRGPRRRQQARIVNLLSIATSAVTYDFVRAQETGDWRDGFTTTRISNQIASDFLRGLSLSLEHELFQGGRGTGEARTFAPRLSQVNASFALSSSSALFRWLGLAGGEAAPPDTVSAPGQRQEVEPQPQQEPGAILPGADPRRRERPRRRDGGPGGWSANFSYSLHRPGGAGTTTQMLRIDLAFSPTENWDVRWNTAYDVESGEFADHVLTLSRDLHDWEANFDFRQTATGNWSFQFRVQLRQLPDLKFDYDQRSRIETRTSRVRR